MAIVTLSPTIVFDGAQYDGSTDLYGQHLSFAAADLQSVLAGLMGLATQVSPADTFQLVVCQPPPSSEETYGEPGGL